MNSKQLALGSAANTDYLATIALLEKGYELTEEEDPSDEWCCIANLEERTFRGSSFLEVLGLITLWESRGDDWQLRDDEPQPDVDVKWIKTGSMIRIARVLE